MRVLPPMTPSMTLTLMFILLVLRRPHLTSSSSTRPLRLLLHPSLLFFRPSPRLNLSLSLRLDVRCCYRRRRRRGVNDRRTSLTLPLSESLPRRATITHS